MFRHYVTTAFRNLIKSPMYSAINILGLGIGLACSILILLFIKDEVSYDAFLPDTDNVYRIEATINISGRPPIEASSAQGPAMAALMEDFSEIETATRIIYGQIPVMLDGERIRENVMRADAALFDILQLPFAEGDRATALDGMTSMVISETMAQKYFGQESALGKTLTLELLEPRDYQITGVIKDLPETSHLNLDIAVRINLEDYPGQNGNPGPMEFWGSLPVYTYLKFQPGTDIAAIEALLPNFIDQRLPEDLARFVQLPPSELFTYRLVNVRDIHLHSNDGGAIKPRGSLEMVYSFGAIAVLILLIASINFTNLATARSSQRSKEIALRKVMGAERKQIIIQFLGEAVLMTLMALLVAVALVEMALPYYNEFIQKVLRLEYFSDPWIIFGLAALAVVVGIGAGARPAFLVSSYRPAKVLKANQSSSVGSSKMRTILVIVQFSISIGLIIATSVIYAQTYFATHMDLGFTTENMLLVRGIGRPDVAPSSEALVERLVSHPDVVIGARAQAAPGDGSDASTPVRLPDLPDPIIVGIQTIDFDFFATYQVEPVAGRLFSREFGNDLVAAQGAPPPEPGVKRHSNVVLNVSAVNRLGFGSPGEAVGKTFEMGGDNITELTVVGVVPDFHFTTLRRPIRAEFYLINDNGYGVITLRYQTRDLPALLEYVEQTWAEFFPAIPVNHQFLDENLADQYQADRTTATMLAAFAALAVVISSLGLFGLASFTAERRTKEIGIRKAMGASITDIVRLLVWQFSKPVLMANIIAWPLAGYFMNDWLQGFQYRIDLTDPATLGAIFGGAGIGALVLAWVTVAGHAFRVARCNPIKALRYE